MSIVNRGEINASPALQCGVSVVYQFDNPALDNPALDNPALDNPALDNPALDNPALDNPALDNPALKCGACWERT
jgi:hypothetical protein